MRRDFGRDAQPPGFGITDYTGRPGRAHMGDMHTSSGQFGQGDIASDHNILGLCRNTS